VDDKLAEKQRKLRTIESAEKFLSFLAKCDADGTGTVSLDEFEKGLRKIGLDSLSVRKFINSNLIIKY
jgi:hypothetical protein